MTADISQEYGGRSIRLPSKTIQLTGTVDLLQRFAVSAGFCALIVLLATAPARAQYSDLMGAEQLSQLLGGNMLDGTGIRVDQVEATDQNFAYMPNVSNSDFAGITFNNVSGSSDATSSHASQVAWSFYGRTLSIAPGITEVDVYEANHWLGDGSLRLGTNDRPLNTVARVVNHSWIFGVADSLDALHRIDFQVNQLDVIQTVGLPNISNPDRLAWKNAFNVIKVGRTDGRHLGGSNTITSVYAGGRAVPDLVATGIRPGATSVATSYAAPNVGAGTALLLQAAADPALSNGTIDAGPRIINHAESSEVIKALLMAGADRHTIGPRTDTDKEDLVDYQIDTQNNLDSRYGAGQMNLLRSYQMLAAGEQNSHEDGGPDRLQRLGWDYNEVFGGRKSESTATYTLDSPKFFETRLVATLAWNVLIGYGQQNVEGSNAWGDETLYAMDLELREAATGELVDISASPVDNTENLFTDLDEDISYDLRVVSAGSYGHDYGLAWRLDPRNRWSIDADGAWSDQTNWSAGDPTGRTVAFHEAAGADRTVTLDQSVTLRGIWFDSSNTYTLAATAGETITLTDANEAARILVSNDNGVADQQVIDAGITITNGLFVDNRSGSLLVTSGGLDNSAGGDIMKVRNGNWRIDGPQVHGIGATLFVRQSTVIMDSDAGGGGANLAITADQGDVRFNVNQAIRSLTVRAGVVHASGTATTTTAQSLSLDSQSTWSAEFASSGHDLITLSQDASIDGTLALSQIDGYTPLGGEQLTLIEAPQVTGTFDLITGTLIDGTNLGWSVGYLSGGGLDSVVASAALVGDLNLDGAVDTTDESVLSVNLGLLGLGWAGGDLDGDGQVTATDEALLQANLGSVLALGDGGFNAPLAPTMQDGDPAQALINGSVSDPLNGPLSGPLTSTTTDSLAETQETDLALDGGALAIPEPASGLLLLGGWAVCARRRRR